MFSLPSNSATLDTEFPAAAALTDNFATPTAPGVGSFLMTYDGSTWDMGRGDATNGLQVNLGSNNDVTVTSGTITAVTSITNAVTVSTHAVTVASGGIASGAVASGAIASGAVASGAFAVGSIVAGAVVAGATSFVKLEDVGSADADAGVPTLAVRKATPANTSGTDGDYEFLQMSAGRLWTSATLDTLISGEDQTNDVLKVEEQYSYSVLSADGQIKATAGFVHSLTFQCTDAAPTAGTIILYDQTTEAVPVVFTFFVTTTAFNPFTVILDVKMTTGIYLGFTTTADVTVTTSYR